MGIEPRPGSLIANIGIILSQLTDGRFKAARHRVRDIQKDCYSIPFVLESCSDAKFDIPNSTGSITYGPWLDASAFTLHRRMRKALVGMQLPLYSQFKKSE